MFVISGVTGNTGSVAAQTLIDAGKDVRVLVRSEEKGQIWKDRGAEVFVADLFDGAAVTKALEGAEAAFLLLPPDLGNEKFLETRRELAEILVKAAEDAALPHAVLLSSVGAQHNEKIGPIQTVAYLERLFEKSTLKYTAVRPGYFLENWGAVVEAVLNDAVLPSFIHPLDFKLDMVATQDIGTTVADALLSPGEEKQRVIELKGANQYSPRDVAQAFSKVLNKDITPIEVPQDAWVSSLTEHGISTQVAETFAEMYANIPNRHIDFIDANAKKGQVELEGFIQQLVA